MTVYGYFIRGDKHAAMCATSIESVRKVDIYARFVVMSDDGTQLPPALSREKLQLVPFENGGPIMLANLEAQCQIIGNHTARAETVWFLDTDILLVEALPRLEDADLAVTWRDHIGHDAEGKAVAGVAVTMPYNYGVIGARSTLETIEAFVWMRERIRKMNSGLQKWYGNQVALAALCGPRPQEGAAWDVRRIPWLPTAQGNALRVWKLPGEVWNFTPSRVGERIHGKRKVLHFKGGARMLMESYARKLELPWAA